MNTCSCFPNELLNFFKKSYPFLLFLFSSYLLFKVGLHWFYSSSILTHHGEWLWTQLFNVVCCSEGALWNKWREACEPVQSTQAALLQTHVTCLTFLTPSSQFGGLFKLQNLQSLSCTAAPSTSLKSACAYLSIRHGSVPEVCKCCAQLCRSALSGGGVKTLQKNRWATFHVFAVGPDALIVYKECVCTGVIVVL